MENNLTTRQYWENYYKHDHANKKHIIAVCSPYDTYWDTLISEDAKGKSIIEIGGYPGRYLAYLANKYEVEPTCLDFNTDEIQIKRIFDEMHVTNFHLMEKDFITYEPEKQYDYVFSLGFIEHFENYNEILDRHLKYLKPGGRLLVMVPNKRYFRKIYGYLVDYKNLKAHNLKCMNVRTFKDFSDRNNLEIKRLEYYGGFPFAVHQSLNLGQKLIYKATRLICKYALNPYVSKHPSKYLSAGLIGVFEKSK